jgi:predicted permease
VPVFGCMLTGYLLVRSGLIASGAVDMLNRLVDYAAFPALPPATSRFVIAKEHKILIAETSGAIWLSTVLGIVAVVTVLLFMGIRP